MNHHPLNLVSHIEPDGRLVLCWSERSAEDHQGQMGERTRRLELDEAQTAMLREMLCGER